MKEATKKRKSIAVIGVCVLAAILVVAAAILLLKENRAADTPIVQSHEDVGEMQEDTAGIPLNTDHIVLTYPADLEDRVTVEYEDLENGQQIVFSAEIAREKLVLFRFFIGGNGAEGYRLGVLEDETEGSIPVCVNVQEYPEGNWKPEEYAELNALQERVNDIIAQFYEDPRFVPSH